ncbi:TetR/AcrR family transcriptional regulator [Streptomyces sp. GC420]|uniref:TetR/AcrR family transcriptional regulator n=1 Tax=Streptomyces sp. GC420 TaxID=2697568 RepID=UPI001414ED89|nr:TetR/AcrR family transcriptional regulator [Streptomyces sp. GC420]NBM18783.1 TetR family transcriptional regulator [Streptomyces sp. GC420]
MSTDNAPGPSEAGDIRRRLLDQAARVLAEQGPAALSARRLVRAVGASTMAVYTHFGSMPSLVRELMREGVDRFRARLAGVAQDADPVTELAALCAVYQEFVRAEPHLYAVMFGGSPLAGFELSAEDRDMGTGLLEAPRAAIRRCMAAGRFRDGDSRLLVRQLWCQLHGLAQLDRARFLTAAPYGYGPDEVLPALLRDFAVGAGDSPREAAASVAAAFPEAARDPAGG